MKYIFFLSVLASLLVGCDTTSVARHSVPTVVPSPTAPTFPIDARTFMTKAYTLGPWPNVGGPFAILDIGDGARDATGVRVYVKNGVTYQHPVVQAQDGLAALARYSDKKQGADLALARKEAQRLISYHTTHARTGDAWWYPYPFDFAEYDEVSATARAPWYSGMAQGETLDLFTQLYTLTHEAQWLTAATHTFASFLYPLGSGEANNARPWVDRIDDAGYLWIEEYPTPNPSDNTINGFGFALFGVINYTRLTGDARGLRLAQGGLTTFLYGAGLVRHPGGISGYSVSHPQRLYPGYHDVVMHELSFFGAVTGDAAFTRLAQAFYQDHH